MPNVLYPLGECPLRWFRCPKVTASSTCSFSTHPPVPTDLWPLILNFPGCHVVGAVLHTAFSDWLLSLVRHFEGPFHVCWWLAGLCISKVMCWHNGRRCQEALRGSLKEQCVCQPVTGTPLAPGLPPESCRAGGVNVRKGLLSLSSGDPEALAPQRPWSPASMGQGWLFRVLLHCLESLGPDSSEAVQRWPQGVGVDSKGSAKCPCPSCLVPLS